MTSRQLGNLGEALVAQWLQAQGWTILARSWHCRWGELDLVAHRNQPSPHLTFVEVKTRSSGSWDSGGLLAITAQKQTKLWKTAQLFLAQRPRLADLPCRFDVALVHCRRSVHSAEQAPSNVAVPLSLGQPVAMGSYTLSLQDYIESAFEQ